jgi:hypothetical protein
MRLSFPHAKPRLTGQSPGQIRLARTLAARGAHGLKGTLWSMIHLLGAAVFLIAMLARMAQADTAPHPAPAFGAAGPATFPHLERLLPSAPRI